MLKRAFFLLILNLLWVAQCLANPTTDTTLIRKYLVDLTQTSKFRNHQEINQLNESAEYIRKVFATYSDSVNIQEYSVNGQTYKNIIVSFGTENQTRIIVGAHYDVCGKQQGADDNASGVVALLELARMLKGQKLNYRIDLVAYSLEEPPYFRTKAMGSYIHAKSLVDKKIPVYGMISVEMIGYFSNQKHSQHYPLPIMSWVYGNKGNYITLVKKFGAGKFVNQFEQHYKKAKTIVTKTFAGPKALPGVDFSDHLNYWRFGISSLMITDTAFYRNRNYHKPTDTLETLDIQQMANVIQGIYLSLISMP